MKGQMNRRLRRDGMKAVFEKKLGVKIPQNKYGVERDKQRTNGFPSMCENETFEMLKLMESAGEITILKQQHTVRLLVEIDWKADFLVHDNRLDEDVICEAKGVEVDRFKMIKRNWKKHGPLRLWIFRGNNRMKMRCEEIVPE